MLSRCPSCGAEVADDAPRCPSCHWDFAAFKRILPDGLAAPAALPAVAPPPPPPNDLPGAGEKLVPLSFAESEDVAAPLNKAKVPDQPVKESPPLLAPFPELKNNPEFGEGGLLADPPFSIPRLPAKSDSFSPSPVGEIPILPPIPAKKSNEEIPKADPGIIKNEPPSEPPKSMLIKTLPKKEEGPIKKAALVPPPPAVGKDISAKESGNKTPVSTPAIPQETAGLGPWIIAGALTVALAATVAIYLMTKPESYPAAASAPMPAPTPAAVVASSPAIPATVAAPVPAPIAIPVPAPVPAPLASVKDDERPTATFANTPKIVTAMPPPLPTPAGAVPLGQQHTSGPPWVFEGKVYDIVTLEAVYGATLVFRDAAGRLAGKTVTGDEGHYRIQVDSPEKGGLKLEVRHPDFLPKYLDEIDPPFRDTEKGDRMALAKAGSSNKPWVGNSAKSVHRDFVMFPKVSAEAP